MFCLMGVRDGRRTRPLSVVLCGGALFPAKILYLHPIHNFAVLQYDPALLGSTPVKSAVLSDKPLRVVRAVNARSLRVGRGTLALGVELTQLWVVDLTGR